MILRNRFGIGTDSHAFKQHWDNNTTGNQFKLGGVDINNIRVLSNSDGDAVYHALYNAISSAIGRSSIGKYYPKDEGPSKKYLYEIKKQMEATGLSIGNISIAIKAKKPKILPIEDEMKENIANIFGIEKHQIGITATSGEGLDAYGKGLGIEVIATVNLYNKTFAKEPPKHDRYPNKPFHINP